MTKDKNLTVDMDIFQAAAVREELYTVTKMFTYDPKCVPSRVTAVREVIVKLDELIEAALTEND